MPSKNTISCKQYTALLNTIVTNNFSQIQSFCYHVLLVPMSAYKGYLRKRKNTKLLVPLLNLLITVFLSLCICVGDKQKRKRDRLMLTSVISSSIQEKEGELF